jgi:amidase
MTNISADLVKLYGDSDAVGLAEHIRSGQLSALEAVDTAISVIERLDPQLNAVVHRYFDQARAQAATVRPTDPFAGVPYLLKDLGTMWEGAAMTNASVWLAGVTAPMDCETVRRVKAAGFVLVGQTNAAENGWATTTAPAAYGRTNNPWNPDTSPGGSSGGSAAAVAARFAPFSECGDAAGSIRLPAALCGVVGLKPTRGRLSCAPAGDVWYGGATMLGHSRTVRDTAAYLDLVAGALPGEPYSPPTPAKPWRVLAEHQPHRLRVGVVKASPLGSSLHGDVRAVLEETIKVLEALGHEVELYEPTLDLEAMWSRFTEVACVAVAAWMNMLEQLTQRKAGPDGLMPLSWEVLQRGRAMSAVTHAAGLDALRVFGRMITTEFLRYDVVLTPILCESEIRHGYSDMNHTDVDTYNARLLRDVQFLFPVNIAGLPAISLPLGSSSLSTPIGMQFIGRYGDEATLLRLARQLEVAMPWRDRKPSICV